MFLLNLISSLDFGFNNYLYLYRNPLAIKFFTGITFLGNTSTIVVLAVLVSAVFLFTHKKWHILMFLFAIMSSEACTFLVKILVHRQRPQNAVMLENSFSFPSGHATIAIAFYGFLIYLLLIKIKNKIVRKILWLGGITLIFLIGFSRLYLGVHFVSDVLVGYLIGLLWLIIGIKLTNLKMYKE